MFLGKSYERTASMRLSDGHMGEIGVAPEKQSK
jgi:hypothetical protein